MKIYNEEFGNKMVYKFNGHTFVSNVKKNYFNASWINFFCTV